MQDASLMDVLQAMQETSEVVSHVVDEKLSIIEAEVQVSEVWQYSDDLIQVSECCQKRAYVRGMSQFV